MESMDIIQSKSRGFTGLDWLSSSHSFSFGNYYDPRRMGFLSLRVLNDDIIFPGQGFGTHPHSNMEIISIPLFGKISHADSTGVESVIEPGDVQIMHAGSGVRHSEFNPSPTEKLSFLQIWIQPNRMNVDPYYEQKSFSDSGKLNHFQCIVSPDARNNSLKIFQNSYIYLSKPEKDVIMNYKLLNKTSGLFLFVIEGNVQLKEVNLSRRDSISFYPKSEVNILSKENSYLLLMELF